VRAIIGQQVSVKSASTVGGRIVQALGERMVTPYAELSRLSPIPARLARATVSELATLGMVSARAQSIIALARAHEAGDLALDAGVSHPAEVMQRLLQIPGIGPWTAHYIAMRALAWPDAFPKEDIVVRQRLGNLTASLAERRSQAWRPWRSYAVLLLWQDTSLPGQIPQAA
jgi:AraC family transcriptional regulator of adaptative response / DNA-3-methyladenine glycosylase II